MGCFMTHLEIKQELVRIMCLSSPTALYPSDTIHELLDEVRIQTKYNLLDIEALKREKANGQKG